VLFITGVSFGYFVVLPAALRFFQNFKTSEFNVLVQAGPYYHFAGVTLLAMGLLFQVPVAVLAATRVGVVSVRQLRHNRRYALLRVAWSRHCYPETRPRSSSRRCRSTCCSS
jgi:sec-independent protein translocase protein TatC